jgi:hypothetical protein
LASVKRKNATLLDALEQYAIEENWEFAVGHGWCWCGIRKPADIARDALTKARGAK